MSIFLTHEHDFAQFFAEQGYCVLNLFQLHSLQNIQAALLSQLRSITNIPDITLETYHRFITDDKQHTDIQVKLNDFMRAGAFLDQVIIDNLPLFTRLVGPDIHLQTNPYLRIVRPGKSTDNIGFHRDTFYGGSPHEISLVIPFVDLNEKNALHVEAGSHKKAEADIPLIQEQSQDVTKGSAKHQIGFLYAPKRISPDYSLNMQPVPLHVGQILAFSLATLHGTEGNYSDTTRWSTDVRIMNSYAPVDLSARPHYYKALCVSPISRSAHQYESVNKDRGSNPVTNVTAPVTVVPSASQEEQKWTEFKKQLGNNSVVLGPYFAFQLRHSPRHILFSLSYHKFAAKMIGQGKRVLDIGCSEGLGTVLLTEFASRVLGIDIDGAAIAEAKKTFANEKTEFRHMDMLTEDIPEQFDAAVSFDVIEHIYPSNAAVFIDRIANILSPEGIAIIGTPSETSQQFASQRTKSGHVNVYTAARLEEELKRRFHNVFIFSVNDEMVHTGYSPMANYLLAMAVGPKP